MVGEGLSESGAWSRHQIPELGIRGGMVGIYMQLSIKGQFL